MARSMTAFGRAGEVVNGKEILVEIRSVNNRYLDTSVKISRAYGSLEERVKSYLQSKGISRGKVDVLISVNVLENKTAGVALDSAYAASYIAALRQLRDEFSLPDDISVMKVAETGIFLPLLTVKRTMKRPGATFVRSLTRRLPCSWSAGKMKGKT